jgi:very-short-patch-repair endonuclease
VERPRLHRDNVPAARRLRKETTPSERILWEQLRDRRLDGWKFRRQHPIGRFVLDFYCAELRLALEVDGAVHSLEAARERDRLRQEIIELREVRFVRISASSVEHDLDSVLAMLRRTIASIT